MSKPSAPNTGDPLEWYGKLVASHPMVEQKGATMPYTSLNGHMFSFLTKTGKLALRLPAGEREAFLREYGTTLCEQNGAVLKEYVEVPDTLLKQTQKLSPFFAMSYAYAASLKPKPPPRKKKQSP